MPPAIEDLQSLVEPLCTYLVVSHTKLVQFQNAEASGEDYTPTRELIESGSLRGHIPGKLFWEWRKHGSQENTSCTHGNRRQLDPGRHPVIREEDTIPVSSLSFLG